MKVVKTNFESEVKSDLEAVKVMRFSKNRCK